jgi:hypothetical protein
MNVKVLLAGAALLATAAVAAPAYAGTIIFDSYTGVAGAGNSGTDAQGNPWSWTTAGISGNSVWGAPGLAAGVNFFNTATSYTANDFTISFSFFDSSAIDKTASSGPGGYNEQTRFSSVVGTVSTAWTPVYDGTKSVTFYAPSGVSLSNGDAYFVNVAFNNAALSGATNAGFTAQFSSETAVPELSTWAMMLAGFGALGFAGYRRNKAASVAA